VYVVVAGGVTELAGVVATRVNEPAGAAALST